MNQFNFIEKIIKERRSIRKFKEQPISKPLIDKLIEAALWAPSACNFQAWDFIVVKNKNLKNRLADLGTVHCIRQAPVAIFVCYDAELTKENLANIQSAAAAIQNIILTAHSFGLGSLWATTVGDKEKIKQILKIPPKKELVAVVILGWPDEAPRPPKRKTISQVVHGNFYKARDILPSTSDPEDWSIAQISQFRNYKIRSGPKYNKTIQKEFRSIINFIRKNISQNKNNWLDIFPFSKLYLQACKELFPRNKFHFLALSEETKDFIIGQARGTEKRTKGHLYFKEKLLEKYEMVSVFFQLEGISSKDRKQLIKQILDYLNADGKLIIVFNNYYSYFTLWAGLRRIIKKETVENVFAPIPYLGPYRTIKPEILKKQLNQQGFKLIKEGAFLILPPFEELKIRLRFLFAKIPFCQWIAWFIYIVVFIFSLCLRPFRFFYKTRIWILQKEI